MGTKFSEYIFCFINICIICLSKNIYYIKRLRMEYPFLKQRYQNTQLCHLVPDTLSGKTLYSPEDFHF